MTKPSFYVLLARTPGVYGKSLPETILIAAADNETDLVEYMIQLPYGDDLYHGSNEIETVECEDGTLVCANSFEIREITWVGTPQVKYDPDIIKIEGTCTFVARNIGNIQM